jgi:hypothetical protein
LPTFRSNVSAFPPSVDARQIEAVLFVVLGEVYYYSCKADRLPILQLIVDSNLNYALTSFQHQPAIGYLYMFVISRYSMHNNLWDCMLVEINVSYNDQNPVEGD